MMKLFLFLCDLYLRCFYGGEVLTFEGFGRPKFEGSEREKFMHKIDEALID